MVALVNADWAPLNGEMDIVRCSEKVLSIYKLLRAVKRQPVTYSSCCPSTGAVPRGHRWKPHHRATTLIMFVSQPVTRLQSEGVWPLGGF